MNTSKYIIYTIIAISSSGSGSGSNRKFRITVSTLENGTNFSGLPSDRESNNIQFN
jgi:hypothetical protein